MKGGLGVYPGGGEGGEGGTQFKSHLPVYAPTHPAFQAMQALLHIVHWGSNRKKAKN